MLNQDQQAAFSYAKDCIAQNQSFCLQGWAGTGKTFVAAEIERVFSEMGLSVHILAPTHKALGALRESGSISPLARLSTVHSALGMYLNPMTGKMEQGACKILDANVLIVDEASMIDEHCYSALASLSMPKIWVGDPGQLPPVKQAVSSAFSKPENLYVLTQPVRQEENSPILDAARYLRGCIEGGTRPLLSELEKHVHVQSGGAVACSELIHSAHEQGLNVMGLAYTNKRVTMIGKLATKSIHPNATQRIVEGAPVVFGSRYGRIANTEQLDYAISVRDDGDDLVVRLERAGEVRTKKDLRAWVTYIRGLERARDDGNSAAASELVRETSEYADIRTTLATTVHKSQGSTLDVAVVDFSDIRGVVNSELMARLLYVAVTRAKKFVALGV